MDVSWGMLVDDILAVISGMGYRSLSYFDDETWRHSPDAWNILLLSEEQDGAALLETAARIILPVTAAGTPT